MYYRLLNPIPEDGRKDLTKRTERETLENRKLQ